MFPVFIENNIVGSNFNYIAELLNVRFQKLYTRFRNSTCCDRLWFPSCSATQCSELQRYVAVKMHRCMLARRGSFLRGICIKFNMRSYGGFLKWGVPPNGWFIMEHTIKWYKMWIIWGPPLFRKPPWRPQCCGVTEDRLDQVQRDKPGAGRSDGGVTCPQCGMVWLLGSP